MPDWLAPSTSPSRRCSRSTSASAKPSRVAATALRRCRAALSSLAVVSNRQTPGWAPRPIRPRSWCSWEMPNRSASWITITEALGTSTPTSMTVVETSTSTSPAANRLITASFSSLEQLAVHHLDTQVRQRPGTQLRVQILDCDCRRGFTIGIEVLGLAAGRASGRDPRADHIRLAAAADLFHDALPGPRCTHAGW